MTGYRTWRGCHYSVVYMGVGDKGKKGTKICRISNKGCDAIHLHHDIGIGHHKWQNLSMLHSGAIKPDKDLMYKFAESKDVFKYEQHISTYYMEDGYFEKHGKYHPAIDSVPLDRKKSSEHYDVHWPFDCEFEVINIGEYSDGVTYIIIWFDVDEMEENMAGTLLLEDWQWDMLGKAIEDLKMNKDEEVLNSDTWIEKVKSKELTAHELVWLNTIIMSRTDD